MQYIEDHPKNFSIQEITSTSAKGVKKTLGLAIRKVYLTNEEFKKIPFKYDGDGNPVTFGESGESGTFFTREERRKIKRLIEKGYSVSEAMNKTI